MSYRLIDSNAIADKYPEVNDMPCVFADLPNGLDGRFIDAHPVRHGKWINRHKCSECGYVDVISPYEHNVITGEVTLVYKFCPNCGAKMDEGIYNA